MHRSVKRVVFSVAGGFAAMAALAIGAVVAFACIPIAMLNLSPNSVSPGQTVKASIQQASVRAGETANPVVFHWQTLNGQVLATATPTESGTTATFTVPQVSQPGDYLVVATQQQKPGSSSWGMPARAVLHVSVNGSAPASNSGPAAAGSSNSAGLATAPGMSPGILALIAIGVAAVAISLAGLAVWGVERASSARAQRVSRR
jgi:hypothetical protein